VRYSKAALLHACKGLRWNTGDQAPAGTNAAGDMHDVAGATHVAHRFEDDVGFSRGYYSGDKNRIGQVGDGLVLYEKPYVWLVMAGFNGTAAHTWALAL